MAGLELVKTLDKMGFEQHVFEAGLVRIRLDTTESLVEPGANLTEHKSWLDMEEIELNVLNNQCMGERIDSIDKVR